MHGDVCCYQQFFADSACAFTVRNGRVFEIWLLNGVIEIQPRWTLVAMVTVTKNGKCNTKLTTSRLT